jgi:hypothetical protein
MTISAKSARLLSGIRGIYSRGRDCAKSRQALGGGLDGLRQRLAEVVKGRK